MKIIKEGLSAEERSRQKILFDLTGTCDVCGCEVVCNSDDAMILRNEAFFRATCPTEDCGGYITLKNL